MDTFLVSLLNGLGLGLLLFLLASGLTLVFGMLGVLNFAHAGFYLLGAYLGWALARPLGFWPAFVLAPVLTGLVGAAFERGVLRPLQAQGHAAELLATYGAALVIVEAVQLVWGRGPQTLNPPALLQGAAFTLLRGADGALQWHAGDAPAASCGVAGVRCTPFPATRAFLALVSLGTLAALALLLQRTRIGLVVRAALTHPSMVQALGHDVPRVVTAVFALGCAMAGLAGVSAGATFVVEPGMAQIGAILFAVIVIGGLGSLRGALLASLLVGLVQTVPLAWEGTLADLLRRVGVQAGPGHPAWPLLRLGWVQLAPVLPYALLVGVLALRPQGLLGARLR